MLLICAPGSEGKSWAGNASSSECGGCACLQPPRLSFRFHAPELLPQTSLTTLFLAHPSPSLLLPFLPAPTADAPCLADQRWHDVPVLLHCLLLLFPLLLTVFSKRMRTSRPRMSIILIFLPPLLLPDRVTLKRTAALYCTVHACRVMLTSSSNHLQYEKIRSQKTILQATSMLSRSCFQPEPTPTPHPPLVQRRLLQLLGV